MRTRKERGAGLRACPKVYRSQQLHLSCGGKELGEVRVLALCAVRDSLRALYRLALIDGGIRIRNDRTIRLNGSRVFGGAGLRNLCSGYAFEFESGHY